MGDPNLQNPDLGAIGKLYDPKEIPPVVGDSSFGVRQAMRDYLSNQSFQQQADSTLRTVDLFLKIRPDLTRQQVVDNLPALYESLTGQKHVAGINPFDRVVQAVDMTLKSADANLKYWMDEKQAAMTGGLGAAAEFLGVTGPGRAVVEQAKVNRVENAKNTAKDVAALDKEVSRLQVTRGGPWWLPIVDNSANLVTSIGQVAGETAAGAALAGPVGGALGAWDASSRLMAADSYRTMRSRGVDHDIADLTATTIGYVAGAVDLAGLGGVAAIALKPLLKKAAQGLAPALARAVAMNFAKGAAATGVGTLEEVTQEGLSIAGENLAYSAQNDRLLTAAGAIRQPLTEAIQSAIDGYNGRSLIPLDTGPEIAQRLADTAIQSAVGMATLGVFGAGLGMGHTLSTLREWDKAGVTREKIAAVTQDVQTEKAIAAAKPVDPAAMSDVIQTKVVDQAGAPITVYHPVDQGLAAGRSDISRYGNGVAFFTDQAQAETEARAMSTGPLEGEAFLSTLRARYPQVVADAARAVVAGGRKAAEPFSEALTAWEADNPTMDAQQILDLAESIHTGAALDGRNELVRHYGLEAALPSGGIVQAHIKAEKVAHVDTEAEIELAFKDGAQAVEFAGAWYVKDPQTVVVTGKTESAAETAIKNPVGKLSFQANEGTVRALAEGGAEAGRVRVTASGNKILLNGLTTQESFRRQGVARALVERVITQNPGKTIDWGTVDTPEGKAFQESIRRSLPTWDLWGSRIQAAESENNPAKVEFLKQKADTIPDPAALLSDGSALDRDQLLAVLTKGMSFDEAQASVAIIERMAWSAGSDLDTFLARALENIEWVEAVKDGNGTVKQSANGAAILGAGGRRLIQLVQGRANVSTVLHEMSHTLRPLLSAGDQEALLRWTGEPEWNRAAEERFARGFEQYLGESHPTGDEAIDGVLGRLASWFRMIYDAVFDNSVFTVAGKPVELTDESRAVYDKILQGHRSPEVDGPLFQDSVSTAPSEFEVKRLTMALDFLDTSPFSMPVPFGRTPAILRSFGTPDVQLVMPVSKLRQVMGPDGVDGGHGITLDQVKALQVALADPALAIISRKDPDRVLVFTNAEDAKGRPIMAVIQKNGMVDKHRANVITSIYGRQGAKTFLQEEIDRGSVVYRGDERDGLSKRLSLNWTSRSTLPSQGSMMTRAEAVNGDTRVLFQDEADLLESTVAEKERKLELFRSARDSHLAQLGQGKTSDEKRTLEAVVDEYLANLQAEVEADRQSIDAYRSTAGRPSARREAIRSAVAEGRPVPDAWIQEFEAEAWARDELSRRADMSDQLTQARAFDNLDDYLASIIEDRVAQALGDPFDRIMSASEWAAAEKKARADIVIMPDDFERAKQVYAIAHAKTPEQLDKEFADSLTPEGVKRILAGMNQGGYLADKNLPRHVTAQVTRSHEGGTVDEREIPRILKTMKNDPRTYRRIAQQGFPDLAELEALSLEKEVEQATRAQATEEAPPVIKPIEIPSDMTLEDKMAIRVGTKSRMEWQRKALDAEKELGNLDRAIGILERLSDKWIVKKDEMTTGDGGAEELTALAELAQGQSTKLQTALRALAIDAGGDRTANRDRVVELILTLVKLVRSEMKTKEAARRAYAAQAEEMRKMGAYLAKPAPKTIHVEYARKIERNRSLIDPHFRTMKKSELLALETEWYAAHPDVPAPRSRRGELYGKNLNLWTYEELYAAYLERQALEDMGRAKMIARKLENENRRYGLRQRIVDALYNEEAILLQKIKAAEDAGDTVSRAKFAQKYLEWEMRRAQHLQNLTSEKLAEVNWGGSSYFLTISNLADSLDGQADFKGVNHQMLWSEPNAAENRHLAETDRRKVSMFQWIKDNKIQLGRLKDRIAVDGVGGSFSLDALMTVYVGQKNPLKNKALRFGNRIDQRVFDHVNKAPDLQWVRDLGDRVIQEYEENKNRLFDVAEEYENIDMRSREQENYTPMIRTEINDEGLDQQLNWEAGMAMAVRSANIEKGFTEARIEVGEDHQKPIKMGEFTQWLEMVTKQEQYIAFTPVIKDLKALYLSSEVKDAIAQVHGKRTLSEIDKYIKSLANRLHDKTFSPLDRIMQKLSQHAALAYMAYNIATVLKQFSSLPLFIAHTRPDFLLASMLKMANPSALIRKVDGLSIQMRTRVGYADLDELRLAGSPAGGAKTDLGKAVKAGLHGAENLMVRVADPGMKPMQWVDKLVASAGWDAAFETATAKGLLEPAAIEYADWVVGKTQQSTHAKDTAGVMRDNNSLVKALTLFAGPGVKVYNEMIYGTRASLKNGHHLKAFGTLLGISASALVFYALGKGAPPEDEEWYEWVLLGMMNQVPVFGQAFGSLFQGYDAGNILINQAIESAFKTGQPLATILDQESSDEKKAAAWPKATKNALDIVGLGLGAPVSPVKRIWKAAETGNPGELVGWHLKD